MALSEPYRSPPPRQVNPRLGVYFSIFAAAFTALVIALLILEQLGYPDMIVRLSMVAAPALFAAVIGVGCTSNVPADYFVAGRRVPAFFNGLILAVTTIGATGLLGLTGTFYIVGADALGLAAGFFAGLVLAAVLLVPYLRKLGAYTVPSYLGRRFESRTVRLLAAIILSVPAALILIAEIRVGASLIKSLLGVNRGSLIWPAAIALCITLLPGGMRSLTWSNAAWALIAFIALLVPVCTLSVLLTNLPLAQLTYGGLLPELARLEAASGLVPRLASRMAFDMPDFGVETLAIPFMNSFGRFGVIGFFLVSVTVMLGTAAMPSLLMRAATTPSVFEARKTMGWAVFIMGMVLLTLPAIAVFCRLLVLTDIVGKPPDRLPSWLLSLVQSGQATLDIQAPTVGLASVGFRRDSVLFIMPMLAGFPAVMTYLAVSGVVAALLAGASARLLTLASMLSEDLLYGALKEPPSDRTRLIAARAALAITAMLSAWVALHWNVDPLNLFLWALSLTASGVLPVLIASIWWKRITRAGAVFGMLAGFSIAAVNILSDAALGAPEWLGLDSTLAAVFGVPLGVAVSVVVSLLGKAPGADVRDLVREIRMPGGETLLDREIRLARVAKAAGDAKIV